MKFCKRVAGSLAGVCVLFFLCGFSQINVTGDGVNACLEGNGKRTTEQREVEEFKEISIDGAFNLLITGGQSLSPVRITAESNLLEHIVMEVKTGVLSISTDQSICSKTPVVIKIDTETIQTIISSGATDINFSGVNNQKLKVQMDGAGTVTLAGKTENFSADVQGATELKAQALRAKSISIKSGGSSSAHVFAEEELDAFSNGASEIVYSGSPAKLSKHEEEAGEIGPFREE